ncbi:hypothetical protein ACX1C1_22470 [Paenibacillus sp. strain BS8-2]
MNHLIDVRPLTGNPTVLFVFVLINQCVLLINTKLDGAALYLTLFAIFVAGAACMASVIGIVIMHKKPGKLHIYDSELELYGQLIEAEKIEAIWIRGYFRPVIGIKRFNTSKTLLPWWCFRFKDNKEEDVRMAALQQWADQQSIPVRRKSFGVWF